jgi:SAM-dependent methyltransferase
LRDPGLAKRALQVHRLLQPVLAHPLRAVPAYARFVRDWLRYRHAGGRASAADWFPCLYDRTELTPFDPQYFYQGAWIAERLAEARPAAHVDVGSDLRLMGVLSGFVPITFIDLRPAAVELPGIASKAGTILSLPYMDRSLDSLSSLHVIEHIGLGRYGDPINPQGPMRACRELVRVLAPGGSLYLSVPVGDPRVQYNGQRVFALREIMELLAPLTLKSFSWVDYTGRYHRNVRIDSVDMAYRGGLDYALAMFAFTRAALDAA